MNGDAATNDDGGWTLKTKLIVGAVAGVGALIAYFIIAAVVPRWWAQRLGDTIDGRMIYGSFLGIAIGLIFTAAPLAVVMIAWRWRGGWRRWAISLVVAAIVATPNLATLSIVLGSSSAAHAGDRILDVDGPGFRAGSTIGAVIAVLAAGAIGWLVWSRRRAVS